MTVQEHLELYARIKGVAEYRMDDVCIYFKVYNHYSSSFSCIVVVQNRHKVRLNLQGFIWVLLKFCSLYRFECVGDLFIATQKQALGSSNKHTAFSQLQSTAMHEIFLNHAENHIMEPHVGRLLWKS